MTETIYFCSKCLKQWKTRKEPYEEWSYVDPTGFPIKTCPRCALDFVARPYTEPYITTTISPNSYMTTGIATRYDVSIGDVQGTGLEGPRFTVISNKKHGHTLDAAGNLKKD